MVQGRTRKAASISHEKVTKKLVLGLVFFVSSPSLETIYELYDFYIDKAIEAFQNPIHVGELRQRWIEIKKILKMPIVSPAI